LSTHKSFVTDVPTTRWKEEVRTMNRRAESLRGEVVEQFGREAFPP
jgi:hypothetical protein